MHHRLNGHELSRLQEMVKDREAWHAVDHEVAKSQTRLSKWTTSRACWVVSVVSDSLQPPGSCVHGILQARMLEWVAMPSSRGSSQHRECTHVCHVYLHWQAGSLLRAPPEKPCGGLDRRTKESKVSWNWMDGGNFTWTTPPGLAGHTQCSVPSTSKLRFSAEYGSGAQSRRVG